MAKFDAKELLQQQLEEIAEKNPNKKIKGVELSLAVGVKYNAALQKMVRMVKNDIDTDLMPLLVKLAPEYQTDSKPLTTDSYVTDITASLTFLINKWTSPQVQTVAGQVAALFVKQASGVNRKRFNESMKSFGFDVFGDSVEVDDMLQAAIYNNTQLIKSIPSQYLTQVDSIVMTNVRSGGKPSSIAKSLQAQFGVEKNRAKLIARDQTAKLNGDLAAKRQQAAGFDYFKWSDSGDSRVRDRHEQIDKKVTAYGKGVYRWDFPPLSGGKANTPIIPGQDYQCRCVAIPISQAKVDRNVQEGNTNPGVKR